MGDDAWALFSELCRVVVENKNVFLDVICTNGLIEFMLMPLEDEADDE